MKGIYCSIYKESVTENEQGTDYKKYIWRVFKFKNSLITFKYSRNKQVVKFVESICGKYILLIEGNIYHHTSGNRQSSSISDFEMDSVMNGFIEKGSKVLKHLNGIFSLIFLDLEKGRILFARDSFGLKAGFYSHPNSGFQFASSPKYFEGNSSVDINNMATLLKLRFLPAPLSLSGNTTKMLPGQSIELDLNDVSGKLLKSFFSYDSGQNGYINPSRSNSEIYGELLVQAIERQLPKDMKKNIGIFLSGGVDSSLLAALLVKHSKVPIKAFTVGFEDACYENEIDEASEFAEYLGIEHITTKIKFQDFLNTIELASEILVEPLGTTSVIPMYSLAKLASHHSHVLFSGQGPDEVGAGYTKYQGEWLSSFIPRDLIKLANGAFPHSRIKNESIRRALYSLSEKSDIRRFIKISTLFTDSEIVRLLNIRESKAEVVLADRLAHIQIKSSASSVEKMMALDVRMSLPDDLIVYTNNICQHFNIDCRVPFMDPDLINFVESLHLKEKIGLRKGKITHRKYAQTLLPEYVINRKKKGFLSPTKIWFSDNSDQLKDMLLSSKTFTSIFNETEIRRLIDMHKSGFNMEKQLFLLLSIYYWLKPNKHF